MKRILLPAAALLLAAAATASAGFRAEPVAAPRDGETTFGVGADFTLLGGRAREHVFSPAAEHAEYAAEMGDPRVRRHQLSRLDWDIESVGLVGLKGSARRGIFSLNGGAWIGASSCDDADMKDYDWYQGDHVPYTEYSRSDAELTETWTLDANLSADLFRNDALAAYAFLGYRAQHWEWECDGRNDYWYSENGHIWTHDTGHVCDYEQDYRFAYIGLGGTWKVCDALDFSGYVSWAPGYEGKDKDEHYAAGKTFENDFDYDDGNVYAAGVEAAWHVSDNATLKLALDWQRASLHEGDVEMDDYGEGEFEYHKDAGGYENEYLAATFAFAYSF